MRRIHIYKVSLFLSIFLFPLFAAAQTGMEDVIYFKNGGILRGEIIEHNGNKSLKIKTVGRNIVVVMLEDVKEIKREKIPVPRYYKESGYVNYTGLDILPGQNTTSVRFRMVNGYQFNPRLSVGVGIGYTSYNDPLNLIPLFLDIKYKFLKANATPFVSFKSGYSFSTWSNEDTQVDAHRGGFMINPGIGLQFETNKGFGWYFTAGYNTDHSYFEQERRNGRIIENDISYRRLLLGFGLSF